MKLKFLFLLLSVGFSRPSQAIVLSFDPSDQSVVLSDNASVDLRISGLGDDILTGLDVDVSFDDSILGFLSFTYGTGLDVFGFGTINGTTIGAGVVNVFELSFDFDEDLMLLQPNDFVLGTFVFSTLSIGTSPLDITFALLSGQFVFDPDLGFEVATELSADVQSGSITVVPEPGALALAALALLSLLAHGHRRRA